MEKVIFRMQVRELTRSHGWSRVVAALCSVAVALCVFLARPFAELAPNDDFAYMYSAKTLANTGHIVYYGWSSAMLGWQLALGAVFIKVFGFSFTSARCSILLVSMAATFVLHRLYMRLGLNGSNSLFATLCIALSPLFLPLSFSFMTDIPAVFAILVCLYACVRAVHAPTMRSATLWLIAGTIASALFGTARQTGWLGFLVAVPAVVWTMRRKVRLIPIAVSWLACVAFVFGCMHWFSHQLYTTHETVGAVVGRKELMEGTVATFQILLGVAFFLTPGLLAFIKPLLSSVRPFALTVAVLLYLVVAYLLLLRPNSYSAHILRVPPASFGNYVTVFGTFYLPTIGHQPLQLSLAVVNAITLVTFGAALAFLYFCSGAFGRKAPNAHKPNRIADKQLVALLGPITLSYLALLLFRTSNGTLFDRYLLPLLPISMYLLMKLYQDRVHARVPLWCWAACAVSAVYGVASMHDLFATERAQLQAASELEKSGFARNNFYAGLGYDGWTQISEATHINTGGITLASSDAPYKESAVKIHPCGYTWSKLFPVIHARYVISYDDQVCDPQSQFAPVTYKLWLPPFQGTTYLRKVPAANVGDN